MTRRQKFWTVLLVINVVTFAHYPNPASLFTGLLALVAIIGGI